MYVKVIKFKKKKIYIYILLDHAFWESQCLFFKIEDNRSNGASMLNLCCHTIKNKKNI